MSSLSDTLKIVLKKKPSIRQFANDCGVSHSTIIMILNGRRCSLDNLQAFVRHFANDPSTQRALVISHLRDEVSASGLPDPDKIYITEAPGSDFDFLSIAPAMNVDLGIVARATLKHKEVREIIENLADMVISLDAHIADRAEFNPPLGLMVAEEPAEYRAAVADIDAVEAQKKRKAESAKEPADPKS